VRNLRSDLRQFFINRHYIHFTQKLSPLVTTGLLGVNRHYCVLWIHCNSTRSLISALDELLLTQSYVLFYVAMCNPVLRFTVLCFQLHRGVDIWIRR